MSYILEALKKAELKSENGRTPTLLLRAGETGHRSGSLWLHALVAALFLNAGVIFWWVNPWWPKESQTITHLPAAHPQVPMAPVETPAKTEETDRSDTMQTPPKETELPKPRVAVSRKEDRDAPFSKPRKTETAIAESVQPQPGPGKRTALRGRVLPLSELPSTVRRNLPEFRVSGHAYSPDPGSRVARINDQILQEGQSLTPGLKVEEITPDGIVLGYQGYRFQININTN